MPRTLAENAGVDATHVLSQLYAKHESGDTAAGVNVDVRNSVLMFFLLFLLRV